MDTDVSTLRAQLKAFEREFKATHNHPPSVDDIKNAGFADKYRLYKKLSKLGNATRSLPEISLHPPSTPPRSTELPISIVPRSRAVKTETASTSNPFSPAKNKQKQIAPSSISAFDGSVNPFITPQKAKRSQMSSPKSPSPDLFSSLQTLTDTTCPPQTVLPNNTVSRARKRLRGEPVSPSPVKEKRQRVFSDALPFAKLSMLAARAGDSDDDDRMAAEPGDYSFVADSPMKPPPKGGAFKLLFEGAAGDVTSQDGRARSQRVPVNARLGISLSTSQRARSMSGSFTSETLPDNHPNLKMNASEGNSTKDSTKPRTEKRLYPNGFGKNDIFGTAQPSEALRSDDPGRAKQAEHIGQSSHRTSPAQCSQADTVSNAPDTLCPNHRPLLPPSPPPAVSGSVYPGKGKGRVKVTGPTRKRTKISEDSGDEQDEGRADLHVKIREWSWQRRDTGSAMSPPIEELDPVFGHGAYDRPSSPGPASDDVPGEFEVNLPDDLRRVLAISPSKTHTTRDVSVVRGVLYGERASGYDARKGGDIWNVGEIGEATDSQAEDDWEGEPVPWETGEL